MSFNNRLLQLIEYVGENPNSFGEKLSSSSGERIRQLTKNPNGNPGLNILAEILTKYPNINAQWFITGEGQMLQTVDDANKYEKVTSVKDAAAEPLPTVVTYSCPDCISKQKELDALKIAIEAKDKYIYLLENGVPKKENKASDSAQAS